MSLGTITYAADSGYEPSAPVFGSLITLVGDGAYPTGGTPGFAAIIQNYFRDRREIMAVLSQDCGVYRVVYDKANDKLKVLAGNGTEVAGATDLSGTTLHLLVISQ